MKRPSRPPLRASRGSSRCVALPVALLAALVAGGCSYSPPRFADRPAVGSAIDHRPVPKPLPRLALGPFDLADGYVRQTLTSALDPADPELALDVNAIDEVVTSSWWNPPTDPNNPLAGYGAIGPPKEPVTLHDGPVPTQRRGAIRMVDARGVKYTLLLDPEGRRGLYSTAAIVASRLLFALGYHVPEAWAVELENGRLAVALAWPIGEDLGPTQPYKGRFDDPNDQIARKDRRTLRVLPTVLAWIGKRDLDVGDLRDMYFGTSPKGHVMHYVMGLEGALGVDALERHLELLADPDRPAERSSERLFTLGLGAPADLDPPTTYGPGFGMWSVDVDPDDFDPSPPFEPQRYVTPADHIWIGKRLASLSRVVIAEAVRAAPLDDRGRALIIERLEVRRRALAAGALAWGTPLDPLSVGVMPDGGLRLRLFDRALTAGLARKDGTGWTATLFDGGGERMLNWPQVMRTDRGAEVLVPGAWIRGMDYLVVRLMGRRGDLPAHGPMEVHLALGGGQPPRVVGVVH